MNKRHKKSAEIRLATSLAKLDTTAVITIGIMHICIRDKKIWAKIVKWSASSLNSNPITHPAMIPEKMAHELKSQAGFI
jgi:hypothetical protein